MTIIRRRRASVPRRWRSAFRLGCEWLETRVTPSGANVFAEFRGTLISGETERLPVTMVPADFALAGGKSILGFHVRADAGSALDPAAVQVLPLLADGSDGPALTPRLVRADLAAGRSLALVEVPYGNFTLSFPAEFGSAGGYTLEAFLAGDATTFRVIDNPDAILIRNMMQAPSQYPYQVEGDANLDGIINSYDYTQWRDNVGDGTKINRLTVTLAVTPTPISLPGDVLAVGTTSVNIQGFAPPDVVVSLDIDGDGYDDGMTVADALGFYKLPATLKDGANSLSVRGRDGFGQVAFADSAVSVDRVGPTIVISDPQPGLIRTTNPTLIGNVTDNLAGVASLEAAVDGGSFAMLAPAGGSFQFATKFAEDGSDNGPHVVHFRTRDALGNTSLLDFTFTLKAGIEPEPPGVLLDPASDTGVSSKDGVTKITAPTVIVTTQANASVRLFLNGSPAPLAEGVAGADGKFTFTFEPLTDGTYTLTATAKNIVGTSALSVPFDVVIDTQKPATPNFDLSAASDTGTPGDFTTTAGTVSFVGQTEPGATVSAYHGGMIVATGLVNGTGNFQLTNVALELGANAFTAEAVDVAGNSNHVSRTVTRITPQPGSQDVVLRFNDAALNAIRIDASAPTTASRALAMVSTALLDAVSAIEGTPGFLVRLTPPAGASAEAAAAAAAHRVLNYLYPAQAAAFAETLALALAQVPDGQSKDDGIAFGRLIADATIAQRVDDGSTGFVDYNSPGGPGFWQPTLPMFDVALMPQWATLRPFALTSPDQFRPVAPPDITSADYAAALAEVMAKGRATGSTRTPDETQSALFWADGSGTVSPPGHWNRIAAQLAAAQDYGLSANARLFAKLNVAMADAAISCWNTKFFYGFWRPVSAIRAADTDNNAATAPDAAWTPLLVTPPFPSYTSGHSTFSGAAQIILESFFGAATGFTATTEAPNVAPRTFASFQQAAEAAGQSRILGGIHYQFDNQIGLASGRNIAAFVLQTFSNIADTRAPNINVQTPADTVTATNVTIQGQVVDNLSGVKSLEVKLDGGTYVAVTIDAAGAFGVPIQLALDGTADGAHTLAFRATDFAKNVSTQSFTFTLDTKAPALTIDSPAAGDTLSVASRLTGIASGTGSALTALSYYFDGGPALTLFADPTTGAFDTQLDLSRIGTGMHTLTLTSSDAAGNKATRAVAVDLPAPIPLTLVDYEPTDGAIDVGSTQRPKIIFSRPVVASSLTDSNFYAADSTGKHLAATTVVAADGSFAWLFFANPMPGGSRITVTVDGSTILAADGTQLDAASTGTPGSKLAVSFTTVSLVSLPNTSLTGILADPGPDLKPGTVDDVRRGPDGVLLTADDVYLLPIVGAKIFVLGLENLAVYTDAQGRFTLTSLPVGNVKLSLDGTTANSAPAGCYFPDMVMDLTIRPGVVNTVMGSMGTVEEANALAAVSGVYLPRLKSDILKAVDPNAVTHIDVNPDSAQGLTPAQLNELSISIQPGGLIGHDGQPLASGQVGISTVPPDLVRDMLPPGVLQHTFDITVQAPGIATFATPAPMSFPNVFKAQPGEQLNFLSFDHTTGRLVIEGTATVSPDGKSVTTDPGTGITHPGWHGLTPPGDEDDIDVEDDPDNPDEPDDDNDDVTFEIGITSNAKFFPLSVEAQFGFSLPLSFFEITPDIGVQPLLWQPTFKLPTDGIPISRKLSTTVTVPESVAYFIPEINVGLFQATGKFGIQGTLKAQVEIEGKGLSRQAEITGSLQANVELLASFQISNSLLCRIPYGIGNFICDTYDWTLPIYGPPPIEIGPFDYFLPRTPIIDFSEAIGPIAQVFVGTNLTVAPSVYVHRLPNPTGPGQNGGAVTLPPEFPIVDSHGLNSDGRLYYRYVFDSGQEISGRTNAAGEVSTFLPSNTGYQLTIWSARTNRYVIETGITGPSGGRRTRDISLGKRAGLDADGDGLPDIAEYVIGTRLDVADTDGDGLNDRAEVQQGLDPFGGKALPTGVISTVPLQGEANQVVLAGTPQDANGQTAYVATGTYGLAVVDASQFQGPTVLGQLDLDGNATDVAADIANNLAAVAAGSAGLHIVRVTEPSRPVLSQTIPFQSGANAVEVFDGIAYVANGPAITTVDLLTGQALQTLSIASNTITDLAREGSTLFSIDASNQLRAIDISGYIMSPRGSLNLPAGGGKLFVGGGIAYVGAEAFAGGYVTVDVSNTGKLALLSGVDATNIGGVAVVVNGSGLAISVGGPQNLPESLFVLNNSDPTNTGNFVTRYDLPTVARSLALGAGIAFVAGGTGGLQVVNYAPFDVLGKAPTVATSTPVPDFDDKAAGLQIVEGTSVPVNVVITDDVQVRNVEFLVNGKVTTNDVAFPFDFVVPVPQIAQYGKSLSLQVRATDTGGNVTISAPINVELIPDTFAPTLVGSNVPDNVTLGTSFQVVTLDFSKPLDPTSVTQAAFSLTGPGGAIVPLDVKLRRRDATVQVTYPTLGQGSYVLSIDGTAIKSSHGVPVGGTLVSNFKIAPYSAVWVNPNGGEWTVPSNWDTGKVPGPNDDVLIDVPNNVAITFNGTAAANSVVSNESLTITGGTLTVNQTIRVNNAFRVQNGTLAKATVLPSNAGQALYSTNGTFSGVTLNTDLRFDQYYAAAYITGGLTLGNNAVVYLGKSDGSNYYTTLYFYGSDQTLGGNGQVVFEQAGGVNYFYAAGGTVTVGPGISVHGRDAYVYGNAIVNKGVFASDAGADFVITPSSFANEGIVSVAAGSDMAIFSSVISNTGQIQPTGGALTIGGTLTTGFAGVTPTGGALIKITGSVDNTGKTLTLDSLPAGVRFDGGRINAGTVTTTTGGVFNLPSGWSVALAGSAIKAGLTTGVGTTLTLDGTWSNEATLSVAGGTLNLDGEFTTTTLGTLARNGGTINLMGSYDLKGGTLALDAATGSWNLAGGQLIGGTFTATGGATLALTSTGGLVGMTLASDLRLVQSFTYLNISNGLVLAGNAALRLGKSAGGTTGVDIRFFGDQTIGGAGQIVFEGLSGANSISSYSTLTVDSGITIRGRNGYIGGSTVINKGVIASDAGGDLQINSSSFTNEGTVTAGPLSTVTLAGTTMSGFTGLGVTGTGVIRVTGSIGNTGKTLLLDTVPAGVTFDNGRILGGEVTTTGGAAFALPNGWKLILDGAAVKAGLSAGPGTTLTMEAGWSNQATLTANGGTVNLDGSFDTTTIGTVSRAAGAVNITGNFNLGGKALTLDAVTGSWNLAGGGQLHNGIYSATGGAALAVTGTSYLINMGLASDMRVEQSNATLYVSGNLTFADNAALRVGKPDGTVSYSQVYLYSGNQTLSGVGQVVFESSSFGNSIYTSSQLTIEPTVTVRGRNYQISGYSLLNQGTIAADASGPATLSTILLANTGTITAGNGSTLTLASQFDSLTGISATGTGLLRVTGTLANAGKTALLDNLTAGVRFDGGRILGGIVSTSGPSFALPAGWNITLDGAALKAGVTVGTGTTLAFANAWSNAATVTVTGGTLNLGGAFDATTIGSIVRGGGAVNLTGTYDLKGGALALNATTGTWNMAGGRLKGGTFSATGGATLAFTSDSVFDAMTVASDMRLEQGSVDLVVNNGLTLANNAIIHLGKSDGMAFSAFLNFSGTQTFGGTGQVVFESTSSTNYVYASNVLTIGAGVTVRGRLGQVYGNTIINQGLIAADAGGSMTVSPSTLTNQGQLRAAAGSTLTVSAFNWSNAGGGTAVADGGTLHQNGGTLTSGFTGLSGINGGSVVIGGTVDNTGKTVALDSIAGGVRFNNGRVLGGTVTAAGPGFTLPVNWVVTFDGVAVGSNLSVPAGAALTMSGAWSNSATLTASGGTVNLGGTFTPATVGAIVRAAGAVNVTGIYDLMGGALALDVTTGSWNLLGGTIKGGAYQVPGTAELIVTPSGGTLDGMTLAADLRLNQNSARVTITNGLTLTNNAVIRLGKSDGAVFGTQISFSGAQAITGTGQIVFESSGQSLNAGTSLTIGAGVTVRGGSASIFGSALINQGTIIAEAGGSFSLGTTFTNQGSFQVMGGTVLVSGTLATGFTGFSVSAGGSIQVSGAIDNSGKTLLLDGLPAAVSFTGGRIVGGTVSAIGPSFIIPDGWNLRIDAAALKASVTVPANTTLGTLNAWTNSATIQVTGGTLNLGGTFTPATLGTVTRSAGTVNLTGVYELQGGVAAFNATTGSWKLAGGTLRGGTYTAAGGSALIPTSSTGTLDAMTLASDLWLDQPNAFVYVINGLTLSNGVALRLGNTAGTYVAAQVYFSGSQTLGGAGQIVFEQSSLGRVYTSNELTVGPGITIRGGAGQIYGSSIVNQGAILSDSGESIQINLNSLTNNGQITASGTSTFDMFAVVTTGFTDISTTGGGTIRFNGYIENAGKTLSLDAIPAGFYFDGGRIRGGGVMAAGGAFSLPANWRITLDGTTIDVSVTTGAGTMLTLDNAWTNNGTLTVAGGTLNLGGDFTTATLGKLIRSGGTVNLTGIFDLQGGTLALDGSTGSWILDNGQLRNGTYTATGGASLVVYDGFLQAMTIASDLRLEQYNSTVYIYSGLTLANGANVRIGKPDGSVSSAQLYFSGTQSLNGDGAIVFEKAYYGNQVNYLYGFGLSIGPGITIRGRDAAIFGLATNQGVIRSDDGRDIRLELAPGHINTGLIQAANGGTLTLSGTLPTSYAGVSASSGGSIILAGTLANSDATFLLDMLGAGFVLDGTRIVGGTVATTGGLAFTLPLGWNLTIDSAKVTSPLTAGPGATITLNNTWSNLSTFTVAGGTLNLDGEFTPATLGKLVRTGGTVNLTGTYDLQGGTLALNPTTGSWNLAGGRLKGGTLSMSGGATLVVTGSSYLDAMTVTSDLRLERSFTSLYSYNGLTLANDAVIHLGKPDGSVSGVQLYFVGDQMLGGAGQISFETTKSFTNAVYANTSLTVGFGVTITGRDGFVSVPTFINQGVVAAVPGGQLSISATTLANQGQLRSNGGILNIGVTTWTNAVGAAAVADGGTLAITNQLPAGFTGLSAIGGGEVTYLGTIDNTAKTFFLDTLPAGLRFAGGRITGGTVTTSGGAAYVLPAGSFYRLDSAIVQTDLIINAGTSLELLGGWVNDGTLTLAGGSIHLGGSFTTANLGKLSRTGGIVNLTGAYDLQGGTLALDAVTGSWNLVGGRLRNGTLSTTGGASLTMTASFGYLDAMTLASDLRLDRPNSVLFAVNGLTLANNAVVRLGMADGSVSSAQLNFGNTQTLGGTGQIVFEPSTTGNSVSASGTLTIDSGVTVHGRDGTITGGTVVNQGTILSDAGGPLSLTASTFTNNGTAQALAGGTLSVGGSLVNGLAGLSSVAGGDVRIVGTISNTGKSYFLDAVPAGIRFDGGRLLGGTATTGNGQSFALPAGWNLTLESVSLASGATINSGASLTLSGIWSNAATLTIAGGTLNLGGTFTAATLGTVARSGGTVNLTGTYDLKGGSLALDAASGSWNLAGGYLKDGTFSATGGANLVVTKSGGGLSGMTLASDIRVASSNATLQVSNGLTLANGATVYLGIGDGTVSNSSLSFFGNAVLGGFGQVVFEPVTGNVNSIFFFNSTLTVAPGVTIRGRDGQLVGSTLSNQGTIDADAAGTLVVNPTTFTNQGQARASNGGTLVIGGTLANGLTGLSTASAGAVRVIGTILNTGETLNLDATPSGVRFDGGRIVGGNVSTTAGTPFVLPSGWSLTLDGATLKSGLTAGPGSTLTLIDGWSNAATLTVAGGTLNLGGAFSTTSLGSFVRSGGTVNLTGIHDLQGGALELNPTFGRWNLSGGTLVNGRVTTVGGEYLGATASGSQLVDITLASDLWIESSNLSASVSIIYGLTLANNATIHIGKSGATAGSSLNMSGTQKLVGSGGVVFEAAQVTSRFNFGALTLGAGIFIRGRDGQLSGNSLVNYGTIASDNSNGTLTVTASLTNFGSVASANGGTLAVSAPSVHTGVISAGKGSVVQFAGAMSLTSLAVVNLDVAGVGAAQAGRIDVTGLPGTAALAGTLNVRFVDGFVPAGGDSFQLMTYSGFSGSFDQVNAVNLPVGLALNPGYGGSALNVTIVQSALATNLSPDLGSSEPVVGGSGEEYAPAFAPPSGHAPPQWVPYGAFDGSRNRPEQDTFGGVRPTHRGTVNFDTEMDDLDDPDAADFRFRFDTSI